jgi:hypothetical protein
LYFLGFNEEGITRMGGQEIGARRKRNHASSERDWAEELAVALKAQLAHVSDTGTVAIVLPHEDHGREEGSARMGEVLRGMGWERAYSENRSIRQGRTRQSWTSIKRETIEIFQKGA